MAARLVALRKTTPAELDALATITQRDIDDAVSVWERDASASFRGLLDARLDTRAEKIDKPLGLGKFLPPDV
ncbi:MAG: hypothetical protein ABIW79_06800 [Gemmatimonas sp.]